MDNRQRDWLRAAGRAPYLLSAADALIAEARRKGADLRLPARYFLQQAELLLASGRLEMQRGDGALAATYADLAFTEAGKALALCDSSRPMLPGSVPGREAR